MSKKKPIPLHPDDLEKIVTTLADHARKFQEELAARYAARIERLEEAVDRLSLRLDDLEHDPVPAPPLGTPKHRSLRYRVPRPGKGTVRSTLEVHGVHRLSIRLSSEELVIEGLEDG